MMTFAHDQRLARAHELGIIVDAEDEWLLTEYTWRLDSNGYVCTTITDLLGRRIQMYLHHCIVGVPLYAGDIADHIDRNIYNNSRCNLRIVDNSTSVLNRHLVDKRWYGIRQLDSGRYQVRVNIKGTVHYGGTYEQLTEAQRVRDSLVKQRQFEVDLGRAEASWHHEGSTNTTRLVLDKDNEDT